MNVEVKCDYCGNLFKKVNKAHRFCSVECKSKYMWDKKPVITGVCQHCGREFTYKRGTNNKKTFFCSRSCSVAGTKVEKVLTCVDCGVNFNFVGRTTKLRCDECLKKHKSKQVMESRARKDSTVRVGVGSGGAQTTVNTDLSVATRARINAVRRDNYAKNKERRAAEKGYRSLVITGSDSCFLCGYSDRQEALVVHHISMDRTDNSTDNLAIICANCHMCLHTFIRDKQRHIEDYTPHDGFIEYKDLLTKTQPK